MVGEAKPSDRIASPRPPGAAPSAATPDQKTSKSPQVAGACSPSGSSRWRTARERSGS